MARIKLILFLLTISINLFAANVTSVKNGNWNDPTVWNTGTVPVNGDKIIFNHAVTVSANYNYSSSALDVRWAGGLTIDDTYTLTVKSFVTDNGIYPNEINGNLVVADSYQQKYGQTNIGVTGKILVTGTYSTNGGTNSQLNTEGTLEVDDFVNNGSAVVTIGATGEMIVHGNLDNKNAADFFINGGSLIVEGNYDNIGDGLITINNGGTFHLLNDLTNTGGSDIIVNDGSVTIDGNINNQGGAQIEISQGSTLDVGGDLMNKGGGDMVVDGDLSVTGTLENKWGSSITGTGSITAGNIIDPGNGISPNLLAPANLFSIGNGNWTSTTIWASTQGGASCNCSPRASTNVSIEAGHSISISNSNDVKNLTIQASSNLTIEPTGSLKLGGTLTINGTVVLKNNATASGSLLDNGTITYGASATTQVQMALYGNEYHYISSPIPSVPTNAIRFIGGNSNPNVFQYDESQPDNWNTSPNDDDGTNDYIGWVTPAATMDAGQGFSVYTPHDYTFTLNGTAFNTGNLTTAITYTNHAMPAYDGWNIVGNPYPSAIDVQTFLTDNNAVTDGNVYLWDDDASDGTNYTSADYIQVNSVGTVTNSQTGNSFNGKIAPNQAFNVKATTNGTINFNNGQRLNAATYLLKKEPVSAVDFETKKLLLSLASADNQLYNETLIALKADASDGFDFSYDGYKRKGNPHIAFYSTLENNDLGIQTIGLPFDETEIKLGYDVAAAGYFTLAAKEHNMDLYDNVVLVDKLLGIETAITTNNYHFYTESGTFKNRFVLKIKTKQTEPALKEANIMVYSRLKQIIVTSVNADNPINALKIFNLSGKLILQKNLQIEQGETYTLNHNLASGIYIIHLSMQTFNQHSTQLYIE